MNTSGDNIRRLFREETHDLLSALESSLLELEQRPDDREIVMDVFRTFHTIKGSGAMCGFRDIADFTHEVESVFDMVRKGEIPITRQLIDTTLLARDFILREVKKEEDEEGVYDTKTATVIIQMFKGIVHEKKDTPGVLSVPDSGHGKQDHPEELTYRIRFRPPQDIFMSGTNPLLLLRELRGMGDCRIFAHTNAIPQLETFNHEHCYTYWDILLTTSSDTNAVKDVFIFIPDQDCVSIDVISGESVSGDDTVYKRIGEILLERHDISTDDLLKVLRSQKRFGDLLVDTGLLEQSHIASALAEQERIREKKSSLRRSIRVASDKLDRLVDLVGELVTVQARLTQTASIQKNSEVLAIAEIVERITDNLRDNTLSLRMVPIATLFTQFRRLVRELSKELGKDVQLVIEGAETELDKTVIEQLNDPLVHMIRNCIDHGIEPPHAREAAGKPAKGTLHLSAVHSGDSVLIQVRDDGKGIDEEAVRAHALRTGTITGNEELSERELYGLIFSHGFSTSDNITSVSGRGVGLDIVKKNINSLGGSIHVTSSKGSGTTFTLKLPLTLAIIEGLLVKVGEEFYVLPLLIVEECVELDQEGNSKFVEREIANVRGKLIPYIRLRDRFAIAGERPYIEQIVIAETGIGKIGIVVDHVIGGYKTVIKTLGRVYRDLEGISGATILGDGTIALILDIQRLAASVEKEAEEAFGM